MSGKYGYGQFLSPVQKDWTLPGPISCSQGVGSDISAESCKDRGLRVGTGRERGFPGEEKVSGR